MTEVDITEFFTNEDAFEFSASIAERGLNAGPETWANALERAAHDALLETKPQLDAMRRWAKDTGAWERAEIAAWSDQEVNALFIQLVAGDMRAGGLDGIELEDAEGWTLYERDRSTAPTSAAKSPGKTCRRTAARRSSWIARRTQHEQSRAS